VREEIAAVNAEITAVTAAPLPLEDAEAAMARLLDQAAAQYTPAVSLFARDPDPQLDALMVVLPDVRWDPQGTRAFFAAIIDRGRLLACWGAHLRRLYEHDPAFAHPVALAERASRVAALRQRLDDLELHEERLIVAAERASTTVDRRPDARPSIIFDLSVLAEH
jgi:hypothetical protein